MIIALFRGRDIKVMSKKENKGNEYYVIDLKHIFKSVWHRAWVVVISGILLAAMGFSIASFVIPPKYSSSVMLYVNNSSFSLGGISISSSEITAARSLVDTYMEILDNRTTLMMVIEETGVNYSYSELSQMIDAAPSNETEIMKVTVTSENPEEAAQIANCIARVLPKRISEIIDGATMAVVDSAVSNRNKVSPSITRYTAIGLFIGVFASCAILVIVALMDDTIHDEEYVLQTYDYPILAKVPDLLSSSSKSSYSSYYQSGKQADQESK